MLLFLFRADAWWTKARDLQKILHHLGRVIFGDFCAVLGMSLCNNDECHCTFSLCCVDTAELGAELDESVDKAGRDAELDESKLPKWKP